MKLYCKAESAMQVINRFKWLCNECIDNLDREVKYHNKLLDEDVYKIYEIEVKIKEL